MSTEVECKRVRESDAAVLIEVDGEEHWIPHSQIESMHFNMHERGSIVMTDWIAEKKGLA